MRHIKLDGTNKHVIQTLHGTGGPATDLFRVAKMIDPQATLIGFQGEVMEQGMARFFKRHHDGSFDLRSLAETTYQLKDDIEAVIKQYDLNDYQVTLLGYSNGTNLAINYFKEFEDTPIDVALMYHPAPGRLDVPFKAQPNLKILITSGANDPFITQGEFDTLHQQLLDARIDAHVYHHQFGHSLIGEELEASKELLNSSE